MHEENQFTGSFQCTGMWMQLFHANSTKQYLNAFELSKQTKEAWISCKSRFTSFFHFHVHRFRSRFACSFDKRMPETDVNFWVRLHLQIMWRLVCLHDTSNHSQDKITSSSEGQLVEAWRVSLLVLQAGRWFGLSTQSEQLSGIIIDPSKWADRFLLELIPLTENPNHSSDWRLDASSTRPPFQPTKKLNRIAYCSSCCACRWGPCCFEQLGGYKHTSAHRYRAGLTFHGPVD